MTCVSLNFLIKNLYFLAKFMINLSMFFAPVIYMVVKITHSSFEVVLRTINHTVIDPGSSPSLEVIALCPTV
jgi:hypothetical protein